MEKQMQTARQLPNKFIYTIFLFAAILFAFLKDYSTAFMFGSIGLAFDPFDQSKAFDKRPVWQKVWLVMHVVGVLILLMGSFSKPLIEVCFL